MKVLSLAAAAQLEALLRGAANVVEVAPDAPRLLLAMPMREVLLLGLSSNRGKLMVAAGFGFVMQSQTLRARLMQWSQGPVDALSRSFSADLHNQAWLHLTALSLGLLLLGLVLLQLLSAAMALLKFHNFKLEQHGERLLSTSGLTTQTRAAVRLPRLQRVRDHVASREAALRLLRIERSRPAPSGAVLRLVRAERGRAAPSEAAPRLSCAS